MSFRKYISPLLLCSTFLTWNTVFGQNQKLADSLVKIYQKDSLKGVEKLQLLSDLSFNELGDLRLALQYSEELITLSSSEGNNDFLYRGYYQKANKKRLLGDYPEALDAYFKSAEVASKAKINGEAVSYAGIADVYGLTKKHAEAMVYYNKAIALLRPSGDSIQLASVILNAGEEYRLNKVYDSALVYFGEAKAIYEKKNYAIGIAYAVGNIGMVYASRGKNNLAEKNLDTAINVLENLKDYYPICDYLIFMCNIYLERGEKDVALDYAQRSLTIANTYHLKEQIRDANLKLATLYEDLGNFEKSYGFYKDYIVYRDSIKNIGAVEKLAEYKTNYEVSQKQAEVNLLNRQKQLQRNLLFAALFVFVVIAVLGIFLMRNYRERQKAYQLLSKEKAITEGQRDQTNKALENLKRAQAHLIQSEKLASLGQLTAGIAHEMQNPLNFVNNFSEVNAELITELQEANKRGDAASVQAISQEILNNESKISQHGKRADAIVKGMLQHSRSGESEKRPTDINELLKEYVRLAYHGTRAKDKSFNAEMHTEFDPQAGKINIVPQEIGRVILNLVNNAFYAVTEKSKNARSDFSPAVSVSTKKANNQLFLSVKDNGTGISEAVKEKMFHPFFTTKAPGVGTGLGLSLSYDIVKAHGGEIRVESEEGVGSEFVVVLPADAGEV